MKRSFPLFAVASGASFVARGASFSTKALTELIVEVHAWSREGKWVPTPDSSEIDTSGPSMGFTLSPHEECAAEAAVQLDADRARHLQPDLAEGECRREVEQRQSGPVGP